MSTRNPAVILYDGYGNPLAVLEDDTIFSDQPGVLFAGKDDSGLVRFFSVTSNGVVKTAVTGERTVLGEYYFGSSLITGAASTQTLLTLENPSGSGNNIYLNKVIINGTVSSTFSTPFVYTLTRAAALPTGGTIQTAQLRSTTDASPVGVIRTLPSATAAVGSIWTGSPGVISNKGAFFQTLTEATATFEERKEIVIAPGQAVVVTAGVNSTDWSHWVNLHWNEVAI